MLLLSAATASLAAAQHNTWTSGSPMPTGVWYPGAVAVDDGDILVAGGPDSDMKSSMC
jgi:hypothetical protein